mmetsp:Transcript_6010/g.14358  ORF Transcript_6010/g.14358 Transcript_6010/m.14358 type:complete len:205 (+) Transcript_6010:195-809(+)
MLSWRVVEVHNMLDHRQLEDHTSVMLSKTPTRPVAERHPGPTCDWFGKPLRAKSGGFVPVLAVTMNGTHGHHYLLTLGHQHRAQLRVLLQLPPDCWRGAVQTQGLVHHSAQIVHFFNVRKGWDLFSLHDFVDLLAQDRQLVGILTEQPHRSGHGVHHGVVPSKQQLHQIRCQILLGLLRGHVRMVFFVRIHELLQHIAGCATLD